MSYAVTRVDQTNELLKINEVSLIILVQCSKVSDEHEFYDLRIEVPFTSEGAIGVKVLIQIPVLIKLFHY